jgi:hypothetical protein
MIGGIGAFIFAAAMAALLFVTDLPPWATRWITPVWLIGLLMALVGLWYSGRAGGRRMVLVLLMFIVGVGVYIAGLYMNGMDIKSILQPRPLNAFAEHANWVVIMFVVIAVFLVLMILPSISMIASILSGAILWGLAGLAMLVWSVAGAAALIMTVLEVAGGMAGLAAQGQMILKYALYVNIGAWALAGFAMFSGGRRT